jgi:flagellar M-ring protein FliF
MNEKSFLAMLKQLQALWASLSNTKRVALILGTVGAMSTVLLVSFLGSRENYTVLFAELSPDDAQAISAKLKELKVPAQLEGGGTAILVPEARVHELRLELAGAGLPRGGGVGFELFDKSHLGSTEFEQRINNRRALEGELARTIGTIGAVQSARVHLVLPERSVFAMRKEEASASVVLRLRAGRAFGKSEVTGVVHLVASAVPGLTEDRVSVVSAEGATLHRPRADGSATGQLDAEQEREMASALEERARELLERTVGAGHADVRVSVDLDTSSHEHTDEKFDPVRTSLRSEQKTIEKTTTEGPSVAGVPGAKSNLTTTPTDPPDGELGANVLRQSWTRNWEVDRVTEKVLTPAGRLARLSVAVLVDGTYAGEGPARTFTPRDPAELERLGELVKVAVGYNATRGDSVRVDSARFVSSEPPESVDLRAPQAFWTGQKRWVYLAGAGVLLAVLSALVLALRGKRKKAPAAAGKQDARQLVNASIPATLAAEPPKASLPRGTTEEDRGRTRTEALDIAVRDPASAAIVLRGWLGGQAGSPAPAQF